MFPGTAEAWPGGQVTMGWGSGDTSCTVTELREMRQRRGRSELTGAGPRVLHPAGSPEMGSESAQREEEEAPQVRRRRIGTTEPIKPVTSRELSSKPISTGLRPWPGVQWRSEMERAPLTVTGRASLFQPLPAESSEPGRGAWEMISWADPVSILNGQMGGGRWDDVFASGWDLFMSSCGHFSNLE